MPEPLTVPSLARSAWGDFRRCLGALVAFEFFFKLLEAWLFVPAVALALSAALARAGHVAVSNRDVVEFLLTPTGLLYAAVFATVTVAVLLFEQAGVMALAASERPSLPRAFLMGLRVAELGFVKLALLAVASVPFVVLAGLTYAVLLSRHDINFYLAERPPRFWAAVGVGAVLLLAAVAAAMWLYVRWSLALPILFFERHPPGEALRASRDRVRGAGWRVGLVLIGWQLAALLVGAALEAGFLLLAGSVLDNAGERPTARILFLLAAQGGLLGALSFVTAVGLGLLTRRVYLARSGGVAELAPDAQPPGSSWGRRLTRAGIVAAIAVALLAPLAVWADLPRQMAGRPPVRVTAHRGHSRAAPENTLRAVRQAIDSGADYAEVDVQRTADGAVVLLHDRDLKRVAGDPRGPEALTLDEIRRLDVGRWFGPEFAGEPVPTLAEVIELARGRIKLNIELKLYGPDLRLAEDVARLVREKGFESDCLVTSFSLSAIREMRRHCPKLRAGLIVAHALGDVSRLEVEALSVRADWLSDEVIRAAHRRGQEVHVWTVNAPNEMARLIQRGVDNLITDDPDAAVRVRDEWAGLSAAERLVLASRRLLGVDR